MLGVRDYAGGQNADGLVGHHEGAHCQRSGGLEHHTAHGLTYTHPLHLDWTLFIKAVGDKLCSMAEIIFSDINVMLKLFLNM